MQGVITRKEIFAHPMVIIEGFGLKVLVRSLVARRDETFLDIVNRCAGFRAQNDEDEIDLLRTVQRFIDFERRARDLYRKLARHYCTLPDVEKFFGTLSWQEEGHAIVLSRVHREIRRGRLSAGSRDLHEASIASVEALLKACEEEVRHGMPLGRALEIVDVIEGSELDIVFNRLNESVHMRSRARFERFFALADDHWAYHVTERRKLRARYLLHADATSASRAS
jgi:hypothetical protein